MKDLRAAIKEAYGPGCEWPKCGHEGTELAHITSKGMGGSKHRDRPSNVFWACWLHARISDGEGAGRRDIAAAKVHPRMEIVRMLADVNYLGNYFVGSLAWHMGEGLRAYLIRSRPFEIEWSPEYGV